MEVAGQALVEEAAHAKTFSIYTSSTARYAEAQIATAITMYNIATKEKVPTRTHCVPEEIYGQVIQAFVVPAPDLELTEKAVLKYCADTMETYMVPKHVQFLAELPRTPNGKVDKKQLSAWEESKPCVSK